MGKEHTYLEVEHGLANNPYTYAKEDALLLEVQEFSIS
jgi:hypothetical protein